MIVVFSSAVLLLLSSCAAAVDPEIYMNASQLITSKGYPCEVHSVTTPDGYILGLQRIPYGKRNNTRPRPVVFLQHGLLCSSTNWLTNLEYESLGFILADAGFDVWLGNVRGNTYSRRHQTLKPDQREFWDFSFDEHALLDLPTMVDYALEVSNQSQLFYVGHSQGTVMGFAGFSSLPKLAAKIKLFVALAPVTTVKHIKGAFDVISYFYKEVEFLFNLFGDGEFLPNDAFIKILDAVVCEKDWLDEICGNIFFLICGFDSQNMNMSRIAVYGGHTPAGTSVKDAVHFSQEVRSGKFCKYDYGKQGNIKQYGQPTPPEYDVTKITLPIALFTGTKDWLADPQDVKGLIPKLKNIALHKNIETYDHLDFIWGVNAYQTIYPDIVQLFWKYNAN
jgi:lysosomal acid lipase/cholesteryl ester hydrolase